LCGVPDVGALSTPSYGKMNCDVVVRTVMFSYSCPLVSPLTVAVVVVAFAVARWVPPT
jgi:hypothetical protein